MSLYPPRFAEYIALTVPDYIVSNATGGGGGGAVILLSNSTVTSGSSVGTVIGNFSVSGGSTRAYTFTLVSNPGSLFSVGGSTLAVAAALSNGVDPITARASDTGTSVIQTSFNITVSSSVPANYVPTYELFGF